MRGELTIAACSGCASGTLMTSMRNSAEFGSLSGASSEQPGELVRRAHAARSRTRRCRRCPRPSDPPAPCACATRGRSARWRRTSGFVMSLMSKMRMPRRRSLLTRVVHALRAAVQCGPSYLRPTRRAGSCRPTRRSATPGRETRSSGSGAPGWRCPTPGSRCSCPESRSCRVNARSELVLPANFSDGRRRRHEAHVPGRLGGVPHAGLQADAGIGLGRHGRHAATRGR